MGWGQHEIVNCIAPGGWLGLGRKTSFMIFFSVCCVCLTQKTAALHWARRSPELLRWTRLGFTILMVWGKIFEIFHFSLALTVAHTSLQLWYVHRLLLEENWYDTLRIVGIWKCSNNRRVGRLSLHNISPKNQLQTAAGSLKKRRPIFKWSERKVHWKW